MKQVFSFLRYAVLYLLNLLMLLFLHSYFNFILLIVLTVLPFLSIGCALAALYFISASFEGTKERLTFGEPFLLKIVVRNNSVVPLLNVWMNLAVENAFFGITGKHSLNIPAFVKQDNPVKYELLSEYLGVVSVDATEITVMDWFGFVRFHKKISLHKEYVIVPGERISVEPDYAAVAYGMTEAEENPKKGFDFSEVTDVREYQPGDRLQNIHWKLSAKKDEIMVKERESLSSSRIMVLVELESAGAVLNDILVAAYGIAHDFLEGQTSFTLSYWSIKEQDLKTCTVSSHYELCDWMEQVYYEQPYKEDGLGRQMMQQLFPQMRFLAVGKAGSMPGQAVFSYKHSVEGRICGD